MPRRRPTVGAIVVLLLAAATALGSAGARAAVDGRLDEPAWTSAQRFEAFRTTQPLTLDAPEHATQALIRTDADGIHVGFIAEHPPGIPRLRPRTLRDEDADADRVSVLLDFDGQGKTAYLFNVSLGNAIEDAIVSDPAVYNYDWDGVWYHAVDEQPGAWTVEILIPWPVAPMAPAVGGRREMGVLVSRVMQQRARRWSQPALDLERPTLVAELARVTVDDPMAGSLDLFPYVSTGYDAVNDDEDLRAGVDLFWKPNGHHQLTATINPDFGQVESDDLVVNLSAVETFFSEKRPFFTENQSLFDIRSPDDGLLVNTRRIGAAPDAGPDGATDILAALKYTGTAGRWDVGLFGATEDDPGHARGRDYAVARLRRRFDAGSIGYLGDVVDRPTLDRRAQVHALDADWAPLAGLDVRGQVLASRIAEDGASTRGWGSWMTVNYAPGGDWAHALAFTHYDRDYETNDLGYLPRNNLNRLDLYGARYVRPRTPGARVDTHTLSYDLRPSTNDRGDLLASELRFDWQQAFRDSSLLQIGYRPVTAGDDDLITRGGSRVHLPWNHGVRVEHLTRRVGRLRLRSIASWRQEGVEGDNVSLYLEPTWYFSDSVNATLEMQALKNDAWLLWDGGNTVSDYRTDLRKAALGLAAFRGTHHEWRLKAQWVAVRGIAVRGYDVQRDGSLVRHARPLGDFSIATLGLQLRYRYELAPLSDLYVVYSRGGDVFREEGAGFGDLFDQSLETRGADQFLVKLRLHF